VAIGGDVLIVQKDVQWSRDVMPYMAPSFVVIITHVIYHYTGNMMFPVWAMYLAAYLNGCGMLGPGDNTNISAKSQTAWANDKRFCIPLYTFTVIETISWMWCLVVMSDIVDP